MTKDIYMAHMAGIKSILCQYPKEPDFEELYSKLVAITNWTDKDFQDERLLKIKCKVDNITPDYIVDSFNKIVEIIEDINNQ